MQQLTTLALGQACRIFMALAYPEGLSSIPAQKRLYFDLPADQPVTAFLPPAACAVGVGQELRGETGTPCGYDLRLGSAGFAHLKLRLQLVKLNSHSTWVYMVDTHDAFSKESRVPPQNHPDAKQWLAMQNANRVLKEKIEAAFEQDGLATLNSLLREELREQAEPARPLDPRNTPPE
jgi:hypothetical protein